MRKRTLNLIGLSVLALACTTGVLAQEGYDPLLQISNQFAHPNVVILQDTTGSMAYDIAGHTVGADCRGTGDSGCSGLYTWSSVRKTTSGCTGSAAKAFTVKLKINQIDPSRMVLLKNAMGNSMTLVDPTWAPPASAPWGASSIGSFTNWSVTYNGQIAADATGWTYSWDITRTDSPQTCNSIPSYTRFNPFSMITPDYLPPQDLVGKTANLINWGLITFDTGNIHVYADVNPVDASQGSVIATIESKMQPCSVSGSTCPGSNTDTSEALDEAKASLARTWALDTRKTCGRLYATILVTDGESNQCNPGNTGWSNNDPTGTPLACKTLNWNQFPPGRTDELFKKTADSSSGCTDAATSPTNVQTFVIGVDPAVARCELNLDAYMGRTDAYASNPAKWKDTTSPAYTSRVPQNTTGATALTRFDITHDYAYFASTQQALIDAFSAIVAGLAAGDYTTSAPVASSAAGSAGTTIMLASTEFPMWKGHLYAFDGTKTPGQSGYYLWDAGYNLKYSTGTAANPTGTGANPAYVAPSDRKIYTWNPASSNALVQIATDATTVSTLNTLCGGCGFTDAVANFTLGYDGSSASSTTIRPWVLGSSINSTPAITQAPEKFLQGTLPDHTSFEGTYATRTPLVWMGADDGMLHAFQVTDGKEVLALIPPNLLSQQALLFANYNAVKAPVGEPGLPKDHIYGFAGSPRYSDMYFSSSSEYKTVMLATEGPGGSLLAALDVTDPTQTGTPLTVLWSKKGSDTGWTGLFNTWSTPAAGATSNPVWKGLIGNGFNPSSTAAAQVAPKCFIFDPTTGAVSPSNGIATTNVSSPAPWVGNQTFADSVFYSTYADAYYADNLVNMAVQADLNGRIWFITGTGFNTATVGIDATNKAGQQQPIYYSPAVNGFKVGSVYYDLYAFGAGTAYEKSDKITGSNVGLPPTTGTPPTVYFQPSLYLATVQSGSVASATNIVRVDINSDLYKPYANPDGTDRCPGSHATSALGQVYCSSDASPLLGRRTQLTAPPALFVPTGSTSGDPVAVFLLYDPDAGCAGNAYIIQLNFFISGTGASAAPTLKKAFAFDAGAGAASGFAVAGSQVIVAKSAVGAGAQAGVTAVPGLNPTAGMSNPTPIWWRELK